MKVIFLTIMLILGVISWLITCGVVGLICMCFGLTYSWGLATGIWLVLILLKAVFGGK